MSKMTIEEFNNEKKELKKELEKIFNENYSIFISGSGPSIYEYIGRHWVDCCIITITPKYEKIENYNLFQYKRDYPNCPIFSNEYQEILKKYNYKSVMMWNYGIMFQLFKNKEVKETPCYN